jgi:N-acetylglucosaminyl-diphospho-decaprenol L-rhamnosyltransferase
VVPTHDTRDVTLRCLQSVLDDRLPGLELILVDDLSSDGTVAAVEAAHPEVRVVPLARRSGFAAAANAGLRVATGDVLFLLNSDAEVAQGAMARLVDAFARTPKLGAAGPEIVGEDGRPQWSAGVLPTRFWLFALASGLPRLLEHVPGYRRLHPVGAAGGRRVEWLSGAALAIGRDAWAAGGPLDESFGFYAQDLDLCSRLRELGFGLEVVEGALVRHLGGFTIGQTGETVTGRQHPAFLWTDLVRWVAKHRGREAGQSAARLMARAAALRLVARALTRPFVTAARRPAWDRDTEAFRAARAALGR